MNAIELLTHFHKEGLFDGRLFRVLHNFFNNYTSCLIANGADAQAIDSILTSYVTLIAECISKPYHFEPYHSMIRSPIDYYFFGMEFVRPLIDMKESRLLGKEHLDEIIAYLARGENVIFFGNHQIEAEPQVFSILIEQEYPQLALDTIFVSGDRVINDPVAIPFSMGRNLLCIYSKRHMETPHELYDMKLRHNQKAMNVMKELLTTGGRCIYVAPSGGRDRPDNTGSITPARFDPQSIEMFILMTRKAKVPTHFYPLSLATYPLMPPPSTIDITLGEKRTVNHVAVGMYVDKEFILDDNNDGNGHKHIKREARADAIWDRVCNGYNALIDTLGR